MRIRIPTLFRQPDPAQTPPPAPAGIAPRQVEASTEPGVMVTYMDSRIPEVDSAFGYGHLDGRRGVEPENFRQFIRHTVEGEGIAQRLALAEERERGARERLSTAIEQRAELAGRTAELRGLEARSGEAATSLASARESLREAETEAEKQRGVGSRIQALLFLAAGALFIGGDVVMAREIVADALDMAGRESWVFAVGLAMISVVLKPAYDRLVEKPYHEGQVRRFAYVICTLALIAFGTLYVLGRFRSEAHANKARIEEISGNRDLEPADKQQQVREIQGKMLDSPLAKLSFVLSGILFAAAGAVSLSVGFGYGRQYLYQRLPAERRARDERRREKDLAARREQLIAESDRVRAQLERITAVLADAPASVELEAEVKRLEAERDVLAREMVDTRSQRLRSLYDDGYELGGVNAREEAAQAAEAAAAEERPARKRPRPFVAVRRAIREVKLGPNLLN